MDVPVFWFGPLGRLIPLAPPSPGVERTVEMAGSVSQSVNGSKTLDVRGYRRVWELESAHLDPEDLSALELFYTGGARDALRLRDPIQKNLLPRVAAAAAKDYSWAGGSRSWTTTTGGVSTVYDQTPDLNTSDIYGAPSKYSPKSLVRWTPAASGTLRPHSSTTLSGRDVVPVIPAEPLALSALVRSAGTSVSTTMSLVWVNASLGTISSSSQSFTPTSSWVRQSVTGTAPATAVGALVQFSVPGAASLDFAQLQLEEGSTATDWLLGDGCPEVLFTAMSEASQIYPLVSASITLEER